jgi:hypothetical protein
VTEVERKSKAVENTLTATPADAKVAVQRLREEVLLLRGSAELPHRNVATLGYLLYSEHLLAVELAGTLLLVATIGAVAIALLPKYGRQDETLHLQEPGRATARR